MKEFSLDFDGSILDENSEYLPSYRGVYLVYRGNLILNGTKLKCSEIIYIGQAENIRNRLQNHEKKNLFFSRLENGESLFYSYAHVNASDLNRIEAALIYKHKPVLNEEYKNNFPYLKTHLISFGECALLNKDFTIE